LRRFRALANSGHATTHLHRHPTRSNGARFRRRGSRQTAEALVRPLAVARCDIDLFLTSGAFPAREPFALGHECVGEVVALGDAVRGLEIGQRVVVAFQNSCGACRSCRAGHTANCDQFPVLSDYGMQPLSGTEYGGMLSDLVRVPYAEAMLAPVARDLDSVALASVSDNVLDGYRASPPISRSCPEPRC
jgi:alcohol dehydrogenase